MNAMNITRLSLGAVLLAGLGGCVVPPPTGPSVMVLPGQGKSYAAFQADDAGCRAVAAQDIGYQSPAQAASQSAVGSAVVGTALGAAAGAAIGAAAGNAGAGAAIGAGTGLLTGAAVGAGSAQVSASELQRRYDISYLQCMAAKGNKVPPLPPAPVVTYPSVAPGYYPYLRYPPAYAYYPNYGYLYPPVTFIYRGGWWWGGGGRGWYYRGGYHH